MVMAMTIVPMPMMIMLIVIMLMPMIVLMPMRPIIRLERRRHLDALKPLLCHQRFDLRPLLQPDAVG